MSILFQIVIYEKKLSMNYSMKRKSSELLIILITICICLGLVCGHGRLMDPPSRSSAWRYGFKTEPNYNDNELFCGGFTTQWTINKGKCGICGDPFNGRRDNELPNGKYAKKLIIVRTYKEEQIIRAKVELTANHNGFFIFKLCPTSNDIKEVSQKCLDRFQLEVLNSETSDKYRVPTKMAQMFEIELKLPKGLTCRRCLFQWTYTAANNWGKCLNGSGAVGCGPQETFMGCADIKIVNENENIKLIQQISTTNSSEEKLELKKHFSFDDYYRPVINTKLEPTLTPIMFTETTLSNKCLSRGIWKHISTMDEWCMVNCAANYCPTTHCVCNS